jgi:hypothetical protein
MLRSIALFVVLALAIPLQAQQKPDAPKPKKQFSRKVYVAGVALLAASNVADAINTRQLLNRRGWENNPIFGKHPSPAKQAGINAGIFAAQSFAFYLTERNRHAWVRWTGHALLATATEEHARLAACNAGLKHALASGAELQSISGVLRSKRDAHAYAHRGGPNSQRSLSPQQENTLQGVL